MCKYKENRKRRAAKYNKPYTAFCHICERTREFTLAKKCSKCKSIDINHK